MTAEQERTAILAELSPAYVVTEPIEQTAPFVYCSPHSGRVYPKVLLEATRLDAHTLRKSEDCFVDELFGGVARLGAPLIAARFPRAYLDANREPYELDPELFREPLPEFANTQSMRVAGGLGTIPRIVADTEEIYARPPGLAAALQRIELLHKPFHDALGALLARTRTRFGMAILIDCHSMPSASMSQGSGSRPDFVLGDRFGASCDARVTRTMRDMLAKAGYQVQLNRPYAGGFITESYGRPYAGVHALQLEINRALYLDERTLLPTTRFARLKEDIARVAGLVMAATTGAFVRRAAAE
jgi:N-formylglutamate amidohydrolase